MDNASLVHKDITPEVANVQNVLSHVDLATIRQIAQPVRTIFTWNKISAQMFVL